MVALTWDDVGTRFYETGVDKGVLYVPTAGVYDTGFAWNGLVSVTESPTGGEANAQYADNLKYLNLYSVEEFGATIEAFTYPDEFLPFEVHFSFENASFRMLRIEQKHAFQIVRCTLEIVLVDCESSED